ncbi:MAG: oligosaccharide flippase family protein [Planctomycetota bacterium]|nr:oligosaccharide flippase family protein [Planctomycetota bacterium]
MAGAQPGLPTGVSEAGSRPAGLKSRLLKGGMALAVGEGVTIALRFLRSIIAARLLLPADFGTAATFGLTIGFLELISDLGMDKLLVQSKAEETERLQETSQIMAAIRGLGIAAAILLLAGPVARAFHTPEATGAYRCLAIIPLMRGLNHQDMVRMQRGLRFWPIVKAQVWSSVIGTLLIWPLATWVGNYWAFLWLLVCDAAVMLVFSHALSERRYRWSWCREEVRRLTHFGWPLLINGLLIFAVQQGDRIIIGTGYTMTDLGVYSVASTIAMLATGIWIKVLSTVVLPALAKVQGEREKFERQYRMSQEALTLLSGLIVVVLVVMGPKIILLLYGPKYAGAVAVMGWLAVMQTMRLIRVGPLAATLAMGDSRTALITNIARAIALPIALAAVLSGAALVWMPIAGSIGEVAALAAALVVMRRWHRMPVGATLVPSLYYLGIAVLTGGAVMAGVPAAGLWTIIGVTIVLMGLMVSGMLAAFPDLRRSVLEVVWRRLSVT